MRVKKLMKTLALVLALSLMVSGMPTYAAPKSGFTSSYSNKSWWGSFWDKLFGNDSKEESVEEPTNESTEESVQEPVEEPTDETELTLVEDESTVENGEMLRASTYALARTSDTETIAETTNKVKYFPVTMYDYDASTINAATDALDNDLTVREGIYFSNGGTEVPFTKSSYINVEYMVEDQNAVIEDGTYLIYCTDTSYYMKNEVNENSYWKTTVLNGTTANDIANATEWTFTRQEDGTYAIQDSTGAYLTITGNNAATMSTEENTVSILVSDADTFTVQLYDDAGNGNGYLNSLGGTYYNSGYFGGYSSGSSFLIREIAGNNTFTITANDSIVSLTNIKVTGNHEFVIVEDENIDVNGDENVDDDVNADSVEGEE